MRHKIFSLFLALIASLSMIKAEIPTVADLAEKYDVENNVVFCIQFIEEAEVCNDVVMKVNSNSWDQLLKFAPIPEFEDWYALEVPYNELFEGQIFIIASNGELNKEYQTGDKDAWVHVGGLELSIDYIQFTYVGEWYIHASAPGVYIYQLKYWKDHVNPCATQQIGDLFYLLDKENKTAQVTYQYNTGYNYSGLTAISIPTSVTYNEEIYDVTGIGEAAFNYCSSLTSIEIPNSVTNIGNSAFLDCIGFTSIDLPNSVTSIGECAFCYCRNMISIEIPNSVTSIGNGAFNGCTSLTDIYATCGDLERVQQLFNNDSRVKYKPLPFTITTNAVNGTIKTPQNICETELTAFPNYGYHFVRWSDGITDNPRTIVLTQDTTFAAEFEIDTTGVCGDELALTWTYNSDSMILIIRGEGSLNSNYTFGAEAPNFVEKLIFEEGVTTIGNSAFYGLSTINEIHFASSIKTIHEKAFYNCINLSTIFNYRNTPAVVYSNTFDGIDKFSCTLYVPATSLELYRSATGWRDFYYTKAIDDDQAIEITNDQLPMTNKIFIDNQIFILRGDKTYTLTGQQVK